MWNYRVVEINEEEDKWVEVCEVYYDQLGKPMGYCRATVGGENTKEIKDVLEMMMKSVDKAILKKLSFKS